MFTQDIHAESNVANAHSQVRQGFIRKTYLNLGFALLALAGIEFLYFQTGIAELLAGILLGSQLLWFVALGLFMGVAALANHWALNSVSLSTQYIGLGLYVVAESILLAPMLFLANEFAGGQLIGSAALLTGVLFGALTFITFLNQADFSFLKNFIALGGLVALGLIAASAIFGFGLGIWFSGAMILFAGATILYETSNVMHHYNEGQYVAAALALFASIVLLFWYILQFLMQFASGE